jgi:hypothetical protein
MGVLDHILARSGMGRRVVLAVPMTLAPLLAGLALGGITNVVAAGPPCGGGVLSTAGNTSTCTYAPVGGGTDTFTVPLNVISIAVDAFGAAGGAGGTETNVPGSGVVGGLGGEAQSAVAVTSGQVLQVNVGGMGTGGCGGQNGLGQCFSGGTGGFNDPFGYGGSGFGGGGGGGSDVRTGLFGTTDRVVVAGGAGGGGGTARQALSPGGAGGNGGGGSGVNGTAAASGAGGGFGGGGGVGGNGGPSGVGLGAGSGYPADSFSGGPGWQCCSGSGGGGGGGGYGGGGGGAGSGLSGLGAGGGGGGGGLGTTLIPGVQSGDGKITISYVSTSPTATVTTPTSSGIFLGDSNTDGVIVTGNATGGSPSGTVSFFACGPSASSCPSGGVFVGSAPLTPDVNNTASATSPDFTPSSPGTWCFRGEYSGGPGYSVSSDGSVSECFTVIVNDLSATGRELAPVERDSFTGTVATFTDPGDKEPSSAFTATIGWGDGSTSTGIVSQSADGYTVTGSHMYSDEGAFAIQVEITEANGDSLAPTATADSEANVAEHDSLTASAINGLTAKENLVFSGTVATFSDTIAASVSEFTATIDWGDGKSSPPTSIVLVAGFYRVIGSHKYLDEQAAALPVTVRISDRAPGTATATATSAITVTENDVLGAKGTTIRATHGHSFSGKVGTFTNTHPNVATDFDASIQWGDGTTSTGNVSGSGKAFTVSGTHTYALAGTFTVTVAIFDDPPGTSGATATSSAHVH